MGEITSYTPLTLPQPDDVLVIVDVHDPTMSIAGTTKQITVQNLAIGAGISPPAGDIGGTTAVPTVVSTHLTAPLPPAQGGTGTFTPLAYGAYGDGTHDDTAAVQAAITACQSAGGGIVTLGAHSYLISVTLTVSSPFVSVMGVNESIDWNHATGGGTVFKIAASFTGASLFSVTASQVYLGKFLVKAASGSPTQNIAASSCDGLTLKNIYMTGTGGVALTSVTRSLIEDVVTQSGNGTYGISLTSCTIVYLNRCNASNASGTANYYLSGCGTIVSTGCEGNGAPPYSLYMTATNDCTFYDFEANGGSASQVYITGCTDLRFSFIYAEITSPTQVTIAASSIIQFTGGWLSNATGSTVVIDGTSSACHDIILTGLYIQTSSTSVSPVAITGNCYNLTITSNRVSASAASTAAWISDAGTSNTRTCVYSGNNVLNLAVASVTTSSPNVVIAGNAGVANPLAIGSGGSGQTTAPLAFNALSPLTTQGDVLTAGVAGVDQRLAGNATGSTKAFLTSTAVSGVAQVPAWAGIVAGDVPTLNQSTTGNAATATTASGLTSATTTVGVSAATAPSSGQVLTATSGTAATWQTPSGGSASLLVPLSSPVTASTVTAAAGQFIQCDTTSNSITVTLPSAPADKSQVGVKMITQGSAAGVPYTVTINCAGSDHYNVHTTGATTMTLYIQAQGVLLQYDTSLAVWYILGDDLPLGQADIRYGATAGSIPAATGTEPLTLGTAAVWNVTLAGATTFQFQGPATPAVQSLTIYLTQAASGGPYAVTWPGSVTWLSGVAPPTAAASVLTVIALTTSNGGTTWLGTTAAPPLPLTVPNGGTGNSTLTPYEVLTAGVSNTSAVVSQPLPAHPPVQYATTVALASYAPSGTTVLNASANGVMPNPDGMQVNVNDRVLVKNETGANAVYNGIYVVTNIGTPTTKWQLTRAADMNDATAGTPTVPGAYVSVANGLINAGSTFTVIGGSPCTLGTTPIVWQQSNTGLNPAPVATSSVTALPWQFVPCDTTFGSLTVTLPAAPPGGTQAGATMVVLGGSNTVTVAAAGSDVITKNYGATAVTTMALSALAQGVLLSYQPQPSAFAYTATASSATVTLATYAVTVTANSPVLTVPATGPLWAAGQQVYLTGTTVPTGFSAFGTGNPYYVFNPGYSPQTGKYYFELGTTTSPASIITPTTAGSAVVANDYTGTPFTVGQMVYVTGATPGFTTGAVYYVVSVTNGSFTMSTTFGGGAANASGAGSLAGTVQQCGVWLAVPASGSSGGTATVAQGGTGVSSLTGYELLAANSGGTAVTQIGTGSSAQVLTSGGASALPSFSALPAATTGAEGIVQLAGDLGGTAASPSVLGVHGTTVPSAPAAGTSLTATSSSAASWQARDASSMYSQPAGANGATMPRANATSTLSSPATGILTLVSIPLLQGTVVSTITFLQSVTAAAGQTHGWYALLDPGTGSGPVLRAASADQGSTAQWGTISVPVSLNMSTPYTIPSSGLYYVAMMIAATTMPSFVGCIPIASMLTAVSPPLAGASSSGLTTVPTIPSTMAAIGTLGTNRYYWAYTS